MCVTNSPAQGDICRKKFEKFDGRVQVMVADFDHLNLADGSFDAIYAFELIGYSKDWMPGFRAAGGCSSRADAC